MSAIARLLVVALAALHGYFLYVEMFLWTSPRTIAAFGMTEEFAEGSRVLAANQGLYNGFLAAGLGWAAVAPAIFARPLALFFAGCALVAGVFGGVSGPDRIFLYQALPAALALLATLVSERPKFR
jgi:putative membrane protein